MQVLKRTSRAEQDVQALLFGEWPVAILPCTTQQPLL